MNKITLFSWGYFGWGNHTPQLVEAVDAIEKGRGFRPPIFVDVRIRRSVRAAGFTGPAFEDLLGKKRHRWMNSLGNRYIVTRTGPSIQIDDPKAVNELLNLAQEAAEDKRRLIFFCSCQYPKLDGAIACHRTVVATLALAAARKQDLRVEIVEWPGGEPGHIHAKLAPELFRSVSKGRKFIPLNDLSPHRDLGGPPWGTIATFSCGDEEVHRIVGPAIWQKDEWCLQVPRLFDEPNVGLPKYREEVARVIASFGFGSRSSQGR